ncbi:MAG TPA: helical backbone metal receptor [Pseudonocardiaceae bacterium]|nr:helical backbone metal receptor [Pseudonocardiaceae bacterium]
MTDDLGEAVPLTGSPSRVVSLVPSLTESVERTVPGLLVGATDYCEHPSGLSVTRIGGSKYPKVDAVLKLRPDLVLANVEENRPEDVEKLRANGVPVWVTAAPDSVPTALASLRRLLTQGLAAAEPDWLTTAEDAWRSTEPVRATAIVPVWHKPWVVVGRDTFAGDVLRRLGVANAFADDPERYPRPTLARLRELLAEGTAQFVVLPDEPHAFTEQEAEDAFGDHPSVFVVGRYLTWWGPSLVDARDELAAITAAAG